MKTESKERAGRLREILAEDGYCVIPNFLGESDLSFLEEKAATIRESGKIGEFSRDRYSGLVNDLSEMHEFFRALQWDAPFELLKEMGFEDPKWSTGFLFQKPPGSKRLYWHQDWWGWTSSLSYQVEPTLLFLMYYLSDTDKANGCLRVLPGTHVSPHYLHDCSSIDNFLDFDENKNPAMLADLPDEIDVRVSRGDLIIRDARLLHATHDNRTDLWRSLVTFSVAPNFSKLPIDMRRTFEIKRPKLERNWPTSAWMSIADRMAIGPTEGPAMNISRKPKFERSHQQ